ncbi:MAG: type II secretion system protein F [Acidimicrobiia bacterium]|nr:type II secretion system protein F [Acidimicrobiia bacterium]
MRRFGLVGAMSVVLVVVGASPALAQTDIGSGSRVLRIVGVVATAGAIALLGILLAGLRPETDLRRRLGSYSSETVETGFLARFPILRRFANRAEREAERRGLIPSIETALVQANIPLKPGEAIMAALVLAIVGGAVSALMARNAFVGLGVGVAVLVIAGIAVQAIANRERERFETQLPDTLNLVAASLRAGYSLMQAIEAVAQEAPDPTGREFGRAISEIRLGRSPTESLKDIANRIGSVDFDWAVLAIEIQREVGGNLGEVLQTTSETMLQRTRLKREVKAMTAEGRISAWVLGSLPFVMFGYMFVNNRSYLDPLLTSGWGLTALGGGVLLMIAGIFWINRIVKVEI